MEDKKQMEYLFRDALTAHAEPNEELNQNILSKWKEIDNMKKAPIKRLSTIAIAAICIVFITSVSILAAKLFLTPKEVVDFLGDNKLALKFDEENEIKVNQTITDGDYSITLLGIVNGKNLSQFGGSAAERNPERTYAVVAIEHADGTPMPNAADNDNYDLAFFVSVLIKGLEPWKYNIVTMGGSYHEFFEDGILYRLIECDSIEMFADRGLYICVSSTYFFNVAAYDFNTETGEIIPKDEFEGTNVLFDLPLDMSLGDYEKAEKYLKDLDEYLN